MSRVCLAVSGCTYFPSLLTSLAFSTVTYIFTTNSRFAPLLQKNATLEEPSRVIVTGSVAGLAVGSLGKHATFGYSASKAAVIHLSRNLAVELGPRNIRVNAIAPGFFPSKMASGLIEMSGGEKKLAAKVC